MTPTPTGANDTGRRDTMSLRPVFRAPQCATRRTNRVAVSMPRSAAASKPDYGVSEPTLSPPWTIPGPFA